MKKFLTVLIALLGFVFVFSTTPVKAANVAAVNQAGFTQWHLGFDTIWIGKMYRDANGVPKKLIGVSFLGIGYRKYFGKEDKLRGWHPYWEAGTWLLILPYGGIGTQYSIPLSGDETGRKGVFSVGLGLYLYTIIPAPALTLSVSF